MQQADLNPLSNHSASNKYVDQSSVDEDINLKKDDVI